MTRSAQCTTLHPLEVFDGERRSCRASLERHALQRRRREGKRPVVWAVVIPPPDALPAALTPIVLLRRKGAVVEFNSDESDGGEGEAAHGGWPEDADAPPPPLQGARGNRGGARPKRAKVGGAGGAFTIGDDGAQKPRSPARVAKENPPPPPNAAGPECCLCGEAEAGRLAARCGTCAAFYCSPCGGPPPGAVLVADWTCGACGGGAA